MSKESILKAFRRLLNSAKNSNGKLKSRIQSGESIAKGLDSLFEGGLKLSSKNEEYLAKRIFNVPQMKKVRKCI